MQDNFNNVLDATDLHWLDVTYTAKKYLESPDEKAKRKGKRTFKLSKRAIGFGAIAVGCLAALVGFTFVKGSFDGNFLQIAKATVTASLFGQSKDSTMTLSLPCNMEVQSVEDGVIVLSGGKALTSLTQGTVIQNDANGLAIKVDDDVVIVYNGLTQTYVSVGDVVQNNQLLGKYQGSVSASVSYQGSLVVDVVADESAIKWSV